MKSSYIVYAALLSSGHNSDTIRSNKMIKRCEFISADSLNGSKACFIVNACILRDPPKKTFANHAFERSASTEESIGLDSDIRCDSSFNRPSSCSRNSNCSSIVGSTGAGPGQPSLGKRALLPDWMVCTRDRGDIARVRINGISLSQNIFSSWDVLI
jgi:hypothetical protein